MGNSLCNDKRDEGNISQEIKINQRDLIENREETIEDKIRSANKETETEKEVYYIVESSPLEGVKEIAEVEIRADDVTKEDKMPEEANMKAKSIQNSWRKKKSREMKKEMRESINELGEEIDKNAMLALKPNKVRTTQSSNPLTYPEDLSFYNLDKELAILPPTKLNATGAVYHGQWNRKRVPEGVGEMIRTNLSVFEGIWKNGEIVYGRIYYPNQSYFEGAIENWLPKGRGILTTPNGDSFEGEWKGSHFEGSGTYSWKGQMNNHKYLGEYKKGRKEGKGTYYFEYPDVYYQGDWMKGRPHGQGEYHTKEKIYSGFWRFGKLIRIISEKDQAKAEIADQPEIVNGSVEIWKENNKSNSEDPYMDFDFKILKEDTDLSNMPDDKSEISVRNSVYKPVDTVSHLKFSKMISLKQADSANSANQNLNENTNFNQVIRIIEQVFPSDKERKSEKKLAKPAEQNEFNQNVIIQSGETKNQIEQS